MRLLRRTPVAETRSAPRLAGLCAWSTTGSALTASVDPGSYRAYHGCYFPAAPGSGKLRRLPLKHRAEGTPSPATRRPAHGRCHDGVAAACRPTPAGADSSAATRLGRIDTGLQL